jgi:branched-chain amino acid transport system substrate-binding protein
LGVLLFELYWRKGAHVLTPETKNTVPVGVVFSTSNSYGTIGRELRDGALLAIEAVNADPSASLTLRPWIIDPAGSLDAYRAGVEQMLVAGVRHIVGCYTSSSRKEVIPTVEKFDGLLWYPSHYEGFESSPNVIYTGAAPNQHIIPLVEWALPRFGNRVYCVGSNYIWSWENTRIMRDLVQQAGGAILRERYLAVGDTDTKAIIEEIREAAPDFIFNTLIGESSYTFIREYHSLGQRDFRFSAARRPITSCTLCEPELRMIEESNAAGHIACSTYFASIDRPENRLFTEAFRNRFGQNRVTSADSEAAYITVLLLAESLRTAPPNDIAAVKQAVYGCRIAAPQGDVRIEPANNHAWLTPRIGIAQADGSFAVVSEATAPCRPDPYLAFFAGGKRRQRHAADAGMPHLRVVSRT